MLDRAGLEIVAEGEVTQHLEEGVVARSIADIVQVIVLAASPNRLLRRRRPGRRGGFRTGEVVLEGHHACIDEQQGRVVLRHEGRRRNNQVIVGFEITQEGRPDLIEAGHGI